MGLLERLLHLTRSDRDDAPENEDTFLIHVDANLLSDRRTFHLTCRDGSRAPFAMRDLTYRFHKFTLRVHEKALRIVDVQLDVRGERLADAAMIAAFLGGDPGKVDGDATVDLTLCLRPEVVDAHFARLARKDDPWQVLNVRDHEGRAVALDLKNYRIASWRVRG